MSSFDLWPEVPWQQREATVIEVMPRDGLQSHARWIDTDRKISAINALTAAGFREIEVTSFAHPRAVPQLRDAEEVLVGIARSPDATYRALVPNAKGAERALACSSPPDQLLALTVASDTYLAKNQRMTSEEAQQHIFEVAALGQQAHTTVHVAIAGAFWDPYEGLTPPSKVHALIDRLCDQGITDITLAGSLGMEDPRHVYRMFRTVRERWQHVTFAYHVHNLAGIASANVLAALFAGVSRFETSLCGLGGGIAMPMGTSPVGNMATEDLVYMLSEMQIDCGLDLETVLATVKLVASVIEVEPTSFTSRSGSRQQILGWRAPSFRPSCS